MSAANDELERLRAERDEAVVRADAQFNTRLEEVAERDALRAELAEERLKLSRQALLQDGYYERPEEIGQDVAPRIAERLSIAHEVEAERDALKAELDRIVAEIQAELDKTRQADGATLRDENVINGIVNGLGIALRIVRGDAS